MRVSPMNYRNSHDKRRFSFICIASWPGSNWETLIWILILLSWPNLSHQKRLSFVLSLGVIRFVFFNRIAYTVRVFLIKIALPYDFG